MSLDAFNHLGEISKGYQAAQILLTAVQLGLFSFFSGESKSVEELSGHVKCSVRGITILCNALTALGILRKDGGCFRLSGEYARLLSDQSSENYLGMLRHRAHLYERWAKLPEAVRTGRGAGDRAATGDKAELLDFALAMKDAARGIAGTTAAMLDLEHRKSLLDVGGGPGRYSLEFLKVNRELAVTLLDEAGDCYTAEEVESWLKAAGFKDLEWIVLDEVNKMLTGALNAVSS